MTERVMFDADGAPAEYPGHGTTVAAGYLAGGRNNGWTAEEWARVRAFPEIERVLPIYVASPHEQPEDAAAGALVGLEELAIPTGSTACLDMEHDDFAELVAAGYPHRFYSGELGAQFQPLVYCSATDLDDLRRTGYTGPAWVGSWTGEPHTVPGAAAVQWDGGPGKAIDLSTIYENLALAPARDPQEHPMTNGVAILLTPTGAGYYCIDDDGGVFCFGDAQFHGSMGGHHLNAPIVAAAVTVKGDGYVLYARDKGVFPFGAVKYHGNPNDPEKPAHAGPHADPKAEAAHAATVAAPANVAQGPPPDDAPPAVTLADGRVVGADHPLAVAEAEAKASPAGLDPNTPVTLADGRLVMGDHPDAIAEAEARAQAQAEAAQATE